MKTLKFNEKLGNCRLLSKNNLLLKKKIPNYIRIILLIAD